MILLSTFLQPLFNPCSQYKHRRQHQCLTGCNHLLPTPLQGGMRVSSVKRKAEEWRKRRFNATAGGLSTVTHTIRKYLKISTDVPRKGKQREGMYLVCSLALPASRASLAACSTLLLAAGACQCFVPIPGACSFVSCFLFQLPEHCRSPELSPRFWPLPGFSLCPPHPTHG